MIPRNGMALPAALAAAVVLSALALLSTVAARASIREAAESRFDALEEAGRWSIDTRLNLLLDRHGLGVLASREWSVGGADTVMTVQSLQWPWHRISVRAGGSVVVAGLSRATSPAVPWCGAAVVGGLATVAPNSLFNDLLGTCEAALQNAGLESINAFLEGLEAGLVMLPPDDSLRMASMSAQPDVYLAATHLELAPGIGGAGLIVAPSVRILPGATFRGMVVATGSLVVDAGAMLVSDQMAVRSALAARARLRTLGRMGPLSPP